MSRASLCLPLRRWSVSRLRAWLTPRPCGLPDAAPWWIDFADGTYARWRSGLNSAKPGMIVATSGTTIPAAFRRGGAQTIYWEMHLEAYVGTPGAPAPADSVGSRADALFDTRGRAVGLRDAA